MRKHGWELPYHPLQVVAIAVFLALAFAFYVFFLPFVGKRKFEYVVMGIYTPLIASVFFLYVWCAAADPGDPGIFKSKKYLTIVNNTKHNHHRNPGKEGGSISSKNEADINTTGEKALDAAKGDALADKESKELEKNGTSCSSFQPCIFLLGCCPLLLCQRSCSHEQSSEQQSSEDGMFFCSLCEVEVFKYSKHCRVCDKCVDGFDHHCRWLNNCIGKQNYRRFFILMVSALLLLILQWSIGVLVLVRCFVERKQFIVDIASKLGSSFSFVPFVVVVASCTFLAMVATLPLAQLFFFHVLLIKKGISTYDYIIALREQEQQAVDGQHSPQMSPLSSLTGMSSASSFNTFHRAAWCTPPRLFLEDQFDVIPPETGTSKKMAIDDYNRKRSAGTVKISPWALARLNAEELSKAAAQARKKSKILQPVVRQGMVLGQETDSNFGSGSGRMASRIDSRKRSNRRGRLPPEPPLEPLATISSGTTKSNLSGLAPETSASLAPLQLEARSAFHTSKAMSSAGIVASSPDSSLDSPGHPFRVSSSGTEDMQGFTTLASSAAATADQNGIQLSRSTSDGYEASGGEDSDRVPTRIVHRSSNWSNLLFNSARSDTADILRASSSAGRHSSNSGHIDLA